MNIWNWVGLGIAVLYGATSLLAGLSQLKGQQISWQTAVLMAFGGAVVVAGGFGGLTNRGFNLTWVVVLAGGLLLVQLAAVLNGQRMHGTIHLSHHVVRVVLSGVMILLMLL